MHAPSHTSRYCNPSPLLHSNIQLRVGLHACVQERTCIQPWRHFPGFQKNTQSVHTRGTDACRSLQYLYIGTQRCRQQMNYIHEYNHIKAKVYASHESSHTCHSSHWQLRRMHGGHILQFIAPFIHPCMRSSALLWQNVIGLVSITQRCPMGHTHATTKTLQPAQ